MKISFEEILGSCPELYARRVITELGFRHPPICEKEIADHLGIKIEPFDGSQVLHLRKALQISCSWLKRDSQGKNVIHINTDVSVPRQRLGTTHECGHAIIPWHTETNHISTTHDVDGIAHKVGEKEAFVCGSELLMPSSMFVEDALSMKTGISAIRFLADRYITSLEATSIKYARTHRGFCGILLVEPYENISNKPAVLRPIQAPSLFTEYMITAQLSHVAEERKSPLRVKYFVRSRRLPVYIRPGTGIGVESLIFKSWDSQQILQGEMHASTLGSSFRHSFNVECLPLSYDRMVLVLLWSPDRQYNLS